ncbi:MAG: hypothetical protein AB7K08_01360 [Microbacteriaceae bacterium]
MVVALVVWVALSAVLWIKNNRWWVLSTPDLITVSVFILIGLSLAALAVT